MRAFIPQIKKFTLVEVMMASTISVIVLATVLPITMDLANRSQISAIRSDLRGRVNVGRNYLVSDIRGSSRSGMFTTVDTNSNVVAIALPKYVRPSSTDVPLTITGTSTTVNWTNQVIYYMSTAANGSTSLCRAMLPYATFNGLTSAQKKAVLDALVASSGTSLVTLTSNRPIVKNVKSCTINLGTNVNIDGYSPTVQRATVSIGTALLDAGAHTLKFTVVGKNTAASATGYGIGIDSFVVSPCSLALEGESYIASASNITGGTTLATRMMNPSWHNNQILDFPATANSNTFTLNYYYDTWEESVFSEGNFVAFTDSKVAALADGDAVVQMAGNDTTWRAATQATDAMVTTDTTSLQGCTIRTIVQGSKIVYNGKQAKVTFLASRSPTNSNPFLGITDAYIMERSGTTGFNGNGTSKQLTFSGAPWTNPGGWIFDKNTGNGPLSTGQSILIWGSYASGYADLNIDKTKDYIVSYHAGTWSGWGPQWTTEGCQAATALSAIWYNDVANNVNTAAWSAGSYTEVNEMIGVSQVDVTYPDTASYVSQVVDTQITAPSYKDITWTGDLPAGTTINVMVRSDDNPTMANTPAWSAPYTAANTTTTLGGVPSLRYVQFKVNFTATNWPTPKINNSTASLRNVKITWPGSKKMIQFTADIAKGPDRGMFNVAIDGNITPNPLLWSIDLTVAKTYRGKEYADSFGISVKPRNP